jgi:hypothetical protein
MAHQQLTRQWWESRRHRYELYTSQFVLDEAGDGDPDAAARRLHALAGIPLLHTTDDTMALAEWMVRLRLLPRVASADAAHVAIATVNRMDAILTWNCRHLANADIYVGVARFLRSRGYEPPVVCVPYEMMGEDNTED